MTDIIQQPIFVYLREAAKYTAQLLNALLPECGVQNWWQTLVMNNLSVPQQNRIQQKNIIRLEDLDLQALLRVLEKNWRLWFENPKFSKENRTLLHEVNDVRNQDAHPKAGMDLTPRELYRALDVLARYFDFAGADAFMIEKIQEELHRVERSFGSSTDEPNPGSSATDVQTSNSDKESTDSQEDRPSAPYDGECGSLQTADILPMEYLGPNPKKSDHLRHLLANATYVGIDFGTSTSIASLVTLNPESGALDAVPIPIRQVNEIGAGITDHIVPTCLAWHEGKLLIGRGAYDLKSSKLFGRDIVYSIKMELGVDLGPRYYNSVLRDPDTGTSIRTPEDATSAFLKFIRLGVEEFVKVQGLPSTILYSVSVPASFESNQRASLIVAMQRAGIMLEGEALIDEPNAAFLSHFVSSAAISRNVIDSLSADERNVLVFDFGAGTCDISILETRIESGRLSARNRSLSQFHALGGDNIDRAIINESLLFQMLKESGVERELYSHELIHRVVPALQKTAEELKIQCCKYIAAQWVNRNLAPFYDENPSFSTQPILPIKLGDVTLDLQKPTMTFTEFARVMKYFTAVPDQEDGDAMVHPDITSIFLPILNALHKADLEPRNISQVLLVGGSAGNPFIQLALDNYFGQGVEIVSHKDLRTPVSRGAAIHCFFSRGLKCNYTRPITSENILMITSGGGMEILIAAGSPIPTPVIARKDLTVGFNRKRVEFPICVSNEEKILGVLAINADNREFVTGESVSFQCCVDVNKMLVVEAAIGGTEVRQLLLNPLANREMSPKEAGMFSARRRLYSCYDPVTHRPSMEALMAYAYACSEAGRFVEAAETLITVERFDGQRDLATNIAYNYSRAGKVKKSYSWSKVAYERIPNALTAYNYALGFSSEGDYQRYLELLRESVNDDSDFTPSLVALGVETLSGDGLELLTRAYHLLLAEMESSTADESDLSRLIRVSRTLGYTATMERAARQLRTLSEEERGYSAECLPAKNNMHINE